MTKVYLIEPSRQDVSAASEYGELRVVLYPRDDRPSIWHSSFAPHVADLMGVDGYDHRRDYLVAAGATTMLMIVLDELLARHGATRVLLFDAPGKRYVERVVGDREMVSLGIGH